jgi:hypothetical protein
MAFPVSEVFCVGPPGCSTMVSIQAAFRRPDWTLIFVDHNVMITFHIMHFRQYPPIHYFQPGIAVSFFSLLCF